MSKSGNKNNHSALTTPSAASRAQKAVALANGGATPKGSYVGRLQKAAARNFGKSGSK